MNQDKQFGTSAHRRAKANIEHDPTLLPAVMAFVPRCGSPERKPTKTKTATAAGA
eukprot:CAMPEP_0171923292 /NCGR_PEP_ID=MMETSP0993-20121228/21982_1 /TAXON_ID=483369 /ORGANISM="non described non described, Strain CCMP2098" /LENGTH=54 /DNA_ID=CAMNT_0012561261 /DNA_START=636 /DNA_END=800 /DNA_ORIENTATION=-